MSIGHDDSQVLAGGNRRWFRLRVVALAVLLGGCGSASTSPTTGASVRGPAATNRQVRPAHVVTSLVAEPTGDLPAPVQLPATAANGNRLLVMGGLDQATASLADIVSASPSGSERIGELPYAVHDAAGAELGDTTYLLGGGEPSYSEILAVDASGHATVAGHLPVGASDVAAGVIGGSVYVVGGYTGAVPLDTIVSWSGSGAGRVVARLPHPIRYAAVAAIGGRLIVAGGTSGEEATREVYSFDPADGQVKLIGTLPSPLTHAAAAALGGRVFVIGGRGAVQGTQTAAILAVDPVTGQIRPAGRLPMALSDVGAATIAGAVMIVGGRQSDGVLSRRLYALRPHG
jgi:N-acetylneuraminic acid mutarotase